MPAGFATKLSDPDPEGDSRNGSTGAKRPAKPVRDDMHALPDWGLEIVRSIASGVSKVAWRIRYEGLGNIPERKQGFVVVANHQTYMDAFWIGVPVRHRLRYLAWDEAFDWPVVGRALALLGAWPLQIERGNPTALKRSIQWLRDGGVLVIFPEGGRCLSDGEMARFKLGACRIALEAKVPILPATIRGGERIWPRGKKFPSFGKVEVIFHPLLELALEPGEEPRAAARRISEELFKLVDAARTAT